MQKYWYVLYTRPKREKKVAASLAKEKIESFFPQQRKETTSFRKRKVCQEALFKSYVFVHIEASELEKLKTISGVLNLLYWKGKAAVISQEEIDIMKEFIVNYHDIKIEKTRVNLNDVTNALDTFKYYFNGNVLTVKNTMAKANLTSFGFTLMAKVETADSLSTAAFHEKNLLLPS
jgi:transcription antitermination factor NusG